MNRRKLIAVILSAVALLAAAGVLTWHFWPEPPPTTAQQVEQAVMTPTNPLEMSPQELDRWVNQVADTVERLPPHEMNKLLELALQNEELQERFRQLEPETRRRLMNLVSEEQRARLGAEMAQGMVAMLKAMPKSARNALLRSMHKRRQSERARGSGGDREFSTERFMEFHAATTPRQRAQFVRAMREMRRMMEDAGIHD
ncbi:MAG: magnesium transporter MgtE N-terminal domain-containing protein [Planctomycetota bacterium]